MNNQNENTPEKLVDKRANTLCLWATILFGGFKLLILLSLLVALIFDPDGQNKDMLIIQIFSWIGAISLMLDRFSSGIAFIMMISIRLTYPTNRWGKILMWIYLSIFAIIFIWLMWFIITC